MIAGGYDAGAHGRCRPALRRRRTPAKRSATGAKPLRLGAQVGDLVDDLVVFGEPARVVFRPDLRAIDVYVEHAPGTFDELGRDAEALFECIRQTGGLGEVVSLAAILDAEFHRVHLS